MKKEVYPFEVKLEIVQKYLQGSVIVKRLANKYNIASTEGILFWLTRYKARSL